ncbi:lactate utilization protein C [Deinococcus sonorensis]|uniref:Lactate utilization protein C n=2 Tax=Deinococcus sonorensis TaxID=309891 RepID=A0AAU7UG53_9DEIO
MSGEARLEILSRIYRAQVAPAAAVPFAAPLPSRPQAEVVQQFAEYAAEYRAHVQRVSEGELAERILTLLTGRRVLVPEGLPEAWWTRLDAVTDAGQSHRDLSRCEAVLTTCAAAIAETGTVVLDHGPGQGRRALTLIPDLHVCVVRATQVVDSVAEAVQRLEDSVRAGRPLTWISGPSATSDIELSRVEGVHGPRRLHLLLLEDGQAHD